MQFLFDGIERAMASKPDAVAISDDHQQLTWHQLHLAIANCSRSLNRNTSVFGLLADNDCQYVVAQLAAIRMGKTLVPLPRFFSKAQLDVVVRDASVSRILATETSADQAHALAMPVDLIQLEFASSAMPAMQHGFTQVIYTSGSSGNPKGVRHRSRQIEAVVRGLATASDASAEDRYLSLLPLPMLLETICAVFLPLHCGATLRMATRYAGEVGRGSASGIAGVIAGCQPTATVLVPQLLRTWLFEMKATGILPPADLRFVAVGGASVPLAILELAETMGVPVFEGYGLSECCSVVSLNRPETRKTGTAGRVLSGIEIHIEDGEIVVTSPTIMDGYLGMETPPAPWRTGDLGSIDDEGFLTVQGRKDNLLITAFGRNISPEWVETALMADPRIALAVVSVSALGQLQALLIPSSFGEGWFVAATGAEIEHLIAVLCRTLPDYAVPTLHQTITLQDAARAMLMTANGRPIRCRIKDHFNRNIAA